MAKQSDLADERGHSLADAKAQEPLLDAGAKPASKETPKGGGDVMVPAQSPAEVEAQVLNRAGAEGDEHDIEQQLEDAADREAEAAADNDEAVGRDAFRDSAAADEATDEAEDDEG